MRLAFGSFLLFAVGSCLAMEPESMPEVEVCLHFRADTATLESDSAGRLNAFMAYVFEHGNNRRAANRYELDVNGLVEQSPTAGQLSVAVSRHRMLFDLLVTKAGIALEYTESSLSRTRSKYISIRGPTLKEPDRPLEICDARIVAYYPVEAKAAICGKQFGYCDLHCSAKTCKQD